MDSRRPRNPHTLTRWILTEKQKYKHATGDLAILLSSIQLACKIISSVARKKEITALYGSSIPDDDDEKSDKINIKKQEIKKLNEYANDCLINCISFSGKVQYLISPFMEKPLKIKNCEEPKYIVAFDPLDGTSNIDANVTVGTIFGIYKVPNTNKPDEIPHPNTTLQGRNLVCSGYAIYGDATLLILTFGDKVNGFTLDTTIGEFMLTHHNIKIPKKGKIYSVNEGNSTVFDNAVLTYIQRCKEPKHAFGKPKKARYVGTMVADVHRTLLYGGIFMYPGSKDEPNGKLRLLYESYPMSFIIEAAGGKSSNAKTPILDIVSNEIHSKSPIYLGSKEDVEELEEIYTHMVYLDMVK